MSAASTSADRQKQTLHNEELLTIMCSFSHSRNFVVVADDGVYGNTLLLHFHVGPNQIIKYSLIIHNPLHQNINSILQLFYTILDF